MPSITKTASDGKQFTEESAEVVDFMEDHDSVPTVTAVDYVKQQHENDLKLDNS